MFVNCLLVMLGGAIGALSRYLIGLVKISEKYLFPINTFIINVLGCIIIGLVVTLAFKKNLDPRLILFLKVGLCGGFTTFSSFALETETLLKNGHPWIAFTYVILSIIIGVAVIFLTSTKT